MNRRLFLASATAAPFSGAVFGGDDPPRAPIGIAATSTMIHARHGGGSIREPLRFLEFCRNRGAAGVQTALGVLDAEESRRVREAAERWAMYVEGSVALPGENGDLDRFRAELRTIRDCGGSIARTVCLSGRRYEVFQTAAAYRAFLADSRRALQRVEPIARAEGVRLAVENHKDRDPGQLADLLAEIGSEAVGATVDLGNDIALLTSPEETVRRLAPFAASTHLKDARVAEAEDGFRLDDAPLGAGFIDIGGLTRRLLAANPHLHLTLEMITRDPLRVPCLGEVYWATCDAPGHQLAAMLRLVRRHDTEHLSQVSGLTIDQQLELEDANLRACLDYARTHLAD